MPLVIDYNNARDWFDLREQLRPFDLLSFKGSDSISDIISKMESEHLGVGEFSHSGMVITANLLPQLNLDPEKRYVLESTFSHSLPGRKDCPDILTHKGEFGVQVRDLDEVVPLYLAGGKSHIAWCPLLNNPWSPSSKEKLVEQFTPVFQSFYGRRYDLSVEDLLGSLYPELRPLRNFRDKFYSGLYSLLHAFGLKKGKLGPAGWQFCSELVANVYQNMGILDKKYDARDVVPMDFFGCDQDGIPCLVDNPVFITYKERPDSTEMTP